jgi:hypothetical protein
MNTTNDIFNSLAGIPTDAIEQHAYQLWEAAGRPENRDLEFWLSAESDLRARSQTKDNPVARKVPESVRAASPSNPDIAARVKLPVANRKVASIDSGHKKAKSF